MIKVYFKIFKLFISMILSLYTWRHRYGCINCVSAAANGLFDTSKNQPHCTRDVQTVNSCSRHLLIPKQLHCILTYNKKTTVFTGCVWCVQILNSIPSRPPRRPLTMGTSLFNTVHSWNTSAHKQLQWLWESLMFCVALCVRGPWSNVTHAKVQHVGALCLNATCLSGLQACTASPLISGCGGMQRHYWIRIRNIPKQMTHALMCADRAGMWRSMQKTGWSLIRDISPVRNTLSTPRNHYHHPTLQWYQCVGSRT